MAMVQPEKLQHMALVLAVQLTSIGMSIFWNLIGVGLIDAGQRPLGNAASMTMVVSLAIMAAALIFSIGRMLWLYTIISSVLVLACSAAIYTAIVGPADLWPSSFFRVFGASINVLGLVGFALACKLIILHYKQR